MGLSHRAVVVAGLVSFSVACSSSYAPAVSPRVSLIMDGGSWAYVRDGKKYEGAIFGGELDKAVAGNPQAEKYAHQYQSGRALGFVLSLVGAAAAVGGVVTLDAQVNRQPAGSNDVPIAGLLIAGAGLVVDLVGAGFALEAMPHMYDAINAYNDGVSGGAVPPPPPPEPAGGQQKL